MAEQETNVIVAIPSVNDYVWKTSSEKVPHLTLLYLEDLSTDPDLENILEFLQHAVDTSLNRFGLWVDHRGTLGADDADVVFFQGGYGTNDLVKFRQTLLLNQSIKQAYNAVPQFPEWTPHLTLGYPTAPAHPDPRDYPGIDYVKFDKIALWTGDFEGPEFQLKDPFAEEVSMSDTVKNILEHHGVKGMHWGVRKDRSSSVTVTSSPGKRVKTTGGHGLPASEDAVRVATNKQRAKKSSTDALTTKELQEAVNRMNLEQQYSRLNPSAVAKGQNTVKSLLGLGRTVNDVNNFTKSPAGTTLKASLKK